MTAQTRFCQNLLQTRPSGDSSLDSWKKLSDFAWMNENEFDLETWKIQEEVKKVYGFSWPLSQENLKLISKYSPILEVGAGTGIVAKALNIIGADVIATDGNKNNKNYPFKVGASFDVEILDATKAVKKYPRNVLMCWPTYAEDWAFKAAQEVEGHLIYIGEGAGGCCADDKFFELLEKEFELVEEQDKPQWFGLHDQISVYKRK